MAKLTQNPLAPPVRIEDVGGEGKTVVVTIEGAKVGVPSKGTRSGLSDYLTLKEFPKKGLYLNATSRDHLIEGMGSDDTDDYVGRKITIGVVRSENPETKRNATAPKTVLGVWVMPPAEWPKVKAK